jgi:hypothetical protein
MTYYTIGMSLSLSNRLNLIRYDMLMPEGVIIHILDDFLIMAQRIYNIIAMVITTNLMTVAKYQLLKWQWNVSLLRRFFLPLSPTHCQTFIIIIEVPPFKAEQMIICWTESQISVGHFNVAFCHITQT